MPDWDDAVDADYDFVNDELSTLQKSERDRLFIWDIFGKNSTPVDGVLISREQVESSKKKAERLTNYGVYGDPELSIPEWLPTISDCGAWGYKSLPFPPYSNQEMLQFYEELDVSVGVTIDHLVMGSGKEKGRLYIDERAFHSEFREDHLPQELTRKVDVMVEEWPAEWPSNVEQYEPSLVESTDPTPFEASDFKGSSDDVLSQLEDDPRAVYREDDKQFRYELTLENAREMIELYTDGDYSFRLMAAFQGWNPQSYSDAVAEVLDMGYRYVGLGGVAGSPIDAVRDTVTEVGHEITSYERKHKTRVDLHVFGFAKPNAFESVGRSGVSSFDSASMLRAAWTGGNNYHLDTDTKFDAIRIRYPSPGSDLEISIETALRGQECHHALRAYDDGDSIAAALDQWSSDAEEALDSLPAYLKNNRHSDRYNRTRIRNLTEEFRAHFEHGDTIKGAFGELFRKRLVKLLREDDANEPIPFEKYSEVIGIAKRKFEAFPRHCDHIATMEDQTGSQGTFHQLWVIVKDYAEWIGDEGHLKEYRRTLRQQPWKRCNCPVCSEHGIEVAIFRSNDRNRRRGFHNIHRFYEQFRTALPKVLVATPVSKVSTADVERVESFLGAERESFWSNVHDLPVVDVGVVDGRRVHEWWAEMPDSIEMVESLDSKYQDYQAIFLYCSDETDSEDSERMSQKPDCTIRTFTDPDKLRASVLEYLEYEADFLPARVVQTGLGEFS